MIRIGLWIYWILAFLTGNHETKVYPMHVELIGSTSAGKTTLARKMVEVGKEKGLEVFLSDDFMLQRAHISWVRNEYVRRRLIEMISIAVGFTCLNQYRDFFSFVLREGKYSPGSWFYKINRIRNVIRKIGIFEFISRRSESQQIVLADNEGILQGVHNLFVHQNSQADLDKISRYVELVPLPDVVLYLQQREDVLVSRTLERGHARVAEDSPDKVVHFIQQAVAVFDELINAPKIQDRLLIVDGGLNIRPDADKSLNLNFHRVTELVQPGY
jgi:thymidylate kinase